MLKKFSAYLLAGTVTLAGTALVPAAPAMAQTPVSELRDVSPDHWAYNAIQTLVEKYQVMEGFPDGTFRGSKTMTRYELAAALAKVMAKVEQRIAQATGGSVDVDPGVNPEDLRTIARLQREFREELEQVKAKVDTLDSRVTALESRVKIGGKVKTDYRDFTGAGPLAGLPSADFRVRNMINLDASLMEDVSWSGTLVADLYSPQSLANAYLRGTSATPIVDLYMPQSMLMYTPGWMDYSAGIGSLRDHMQIGSTLNDPFKSNIWSNATGGYGFVGTPGIAAPGGTAVSALATPTAQAGAPLWHPGTNVVVDLVDPNNSKIFQPTGNLLSAARGSLGPVKLGLAFQRGAIASPYLYSGATTGLAASLPGFQTWNMGSMAVGTIGLDLGLARLNLTSTTPALTYNQTGLRDKTLSASLDLGTEALGLTAEVMGNTSYTFSDLSASRASLRLGSGNLLDTGFGLSLGLVAGNTVAQPAMGSQFVTTNNLLSGQAEWHSWGAMVKTPAVFFIPSLTLAAQNTGTGLSPAGLGAAQSFASGATIQTDFQLFGLPTLTAEYSVGKFGAGDQTIWNTSAPITPEQLAIRTMVKF